MTKPNWSLELCSQGCAAYSRKETRSNLTDWVKRPQVGAKGSVFTLNSMTDGQIKSSVDKFFNSEDLKQWAEIFVTKPGDLS